MRAGTQIRCGRKSRVIWQAPREKPKILEKAHFPALEAGIAARNGRRANRLAKTAGFGDAEGP
jgi:hypothetical protein